MGNKKWPNYKFNIDLFDSRRDIDYEEIKEICEGNNLEVPEEGDWQSDNYQTAEDIARECDEEYLQDDLLSATCNDDYKILTGVLGLWDGKHEIRYTITKDDLDEMVKQCLRKSDALDYKVKLENGALTIYCYHHDGCNIFEIRKLSKKGMKALIDNYEKELKKEYLKRIKWDCMNGCLA